MVDPLSSVVLAAGVGGVASKLAEHAVDAAKGWIAEHLGKHGAETQRRAEANAAEFILNLANRVERVEQRLRQQGADDELVQQRFTHPDFTATLQDALIGAARTENAAKHELLASLVADRLASAAESMGALECRLAAEAVPRLTPAQIEFLGALDILYLMRPTHLQGSSPAERGEAAARWYERHLLMLQLPADMRGRWSRMDMYHLVSVGCLMFEPALTKDLRKVLATALPDGAETTAPIRWLITESPAGEILRWLETAEALSATPTPAGIRLGEAVFDLRASQVVRRA